ncbi:MAG: PQQ-dependent sugar dehydrogenase [Acidimicrobiales bacterium]
MSEVTKGLTVMLTHPSRRMLGLVIVASILPLGSLATPAAATTEPPPESAAAGEPPEIEVVNVTGVEQPVDLAWREGDPSLYLVSQSGFVNRFADDELTVVLDISDLTSAQGEQGFLGLAFSPDGAMAYINFTDNDGDTNIAELAVADDGTFDRDSMRTVLTIDQPYPNHNGGGLEFGPDGYLYIGTGDGGAGGDPERRAMDLGELLGKMLRIDPSTPSGDLGYTIPDDNPYVGQEGAHGAIWSIGLRNPWRFWFDPVTGDLWIADVGQDAIEEIDFAPATDGLDAARGVNFGWSAFEGTTPFNDDVAIDDADHHGPIFEYGHENGRCSISGGVRARGDASGPLDGWYVFADYCSGELWAIEVHGEGTGVTVSAESVPLATMDGEQITAVRSGADGTVYVLTIQGGVHRLDPASSS